MKIWLINHYGVPPEYYPLARPFLFAKNLIKKGHQVTVIAASSVHNSDVNLIEDNRKYVHEVVDGVPYVYIKCSSYNGNGVKRVINILEFAWKLKSVCGKLERPDVIVATSFDPISCYAGIKYAKKNGIKAIAEIADLWPETLVAYGVAGSKNPIVCVLRQLEKKIYTSADRIVFTMEGAYGYIVEQRWEKDIPRSKVAFINNGIDLDGFKRNVSQNPVSDEDLEDDELFKVVYAGAIRKVNNVGLLLDAAKLIDDEKIKFLIWGDGDELSELKQRVESENISNVCFKGRVEKKYIPYITSHADLNIIHNSETPIMRFGLSLNKLFDYLAAGKPILVDFHGEYNPVLGYGAGVETKANTAVEIANGIKGMAGMDKDKISVYARNAQAAAKEYDFSRLTERLISVIESC